MNPDKPLVTICCLSYYHEKYIENVIESCWNQDYKNIEIIALDDGSKDGSLALLNSLKEKSPLPMQVFGQENTGNIPGNINFMLKKAKGKYVAIISCDDAFLPDAISSKVSMMEEDENIQFVINSRFITNDCTMNKTFESVHKIDEKEHLTAEDILEEDFEHIDSYFIQGSVYRRNLVEKVGYFDEDIISDDLAFRTKTAIYVKEHAGYKIGCIKKPAVVYRVHNNNVSKNIALQLRSVAQFYQRFYPNKKRKNKKGLKNAYRVLFKQHKFKEAFDIYKEYPIYREYTPLIPLWLISVFIKDIMIFLHLRKS